MQFGGDLWLLDSENLSCRYDVGPAIASTAALDNILDILDSVSNLHKEKFGLDDLWGPFISNASFKIPLRRMRKLELVF